MNTKEKESFVLSLFSDKIFFEREILNVKSSHDKLEIINILVPKLIRVTLKNELNFLYMDNLDKFKFSLIKNILFKELANEWLSFASEVLTYTREEAIDEIKTKQRAAFIYSIVDDYFSQYKEHFFREIIDTFLELVEISIGSSSKNQLLELILEGETINLSAISNLPQLQSRVKSARNFKSSALGKLQIKIAETTNTIEYGELENDDKQKILKNLQHLKKEKEELEAQSLDNFDEALERLKNSMVELMLKMRTA